MRTRIIVLGSTALAVLFAVAAVDAQRGRMGPGIGPGGQGRGGMMGPAGSGQPGRGFGRGGPMAPLDRLLDLTDDQRGRVEDITRTARDQSAPLADELEFVRETLHRELFADKPSNAKIAELSGKIANLQRDLQDIHVKSQIAVADVLTAEQRQTMRGHAGRGRGPGPGRR
jgi:Spy/CpxP family protein refolding chaperone